jgi:hypothetical protein
MARISRIGTVEAAVSTALCRTQAARLPLQLLLQHNRLCCDVHYMGEAIFNSSKNCRQSVLLFFAEFLEARIGAQRIPERIEPQKRRRNNHWGRKKGVIIGRL